MALQMRTSHAGLAQRRAPRFTTRLSPSALPALAPRPVLARAYRQPLLSEVDVLRVTETESRQAEGETSIASPRLDAHQPHLETSPDFWSKAKSALGNLPKLAAVGALAVLLTMGTADPAFAARSGGRIGGSSGFSASRSAPSRSFGGAGMGGGMGGYSSRTTVIPRHYHSYSTVVPIVPAPALPFVPFGGPTVIAPVMPGPVYGSPYRVMDTMFNVVFGFFSIFAIATAFQMVRQGRMGAADSFADAGAGPVTVTKVNVVLLSSARELKAKLDRLGATADTSTTRGLQMLLQETALALMRHPSQWLYAGSESRTLNSSRAAERAFNSATLEQRSRIEEETLVNTNGRKPVVKTLSRGSGNVDELMVVSLVVASRGSFSVPTVRSASDLKAVLKRLGGLVADELMAVEVTWSPQAEGDSLTRDEVLADYPDLTPL